MRYSSFFCQFVPELKPSGLCDLLAPLLCLVFGFSPSSSDLNPRPTKACRARDWSSRTLGLVETVGDLPRRAVQPIRKIVGGDVPNVFPRDACTASLKKVPYRRCRDKTEILLGQMNAKARAVSNQSHLQQASTLAKSNARKLKTGRLRTARGSSPPSSRAFAMRREARQHLHRPFHPRFWRQELRRSHCPVPELGGGPS